MRAKEIRERSIEELQALLTEKSDELFRARLKNATLRITITDRKTGRSRELQAATVMYDVKEGQGDMHFGENVHLANGTYRVTVSVGGERAVFTKVAVDRP